MKRLAIAIITLLVLPPPARPQPPSAPPPSLPANVTKRVGNVTFVADTHLAVPGGILILRLQSRVGLGTTIANFDGRRIPFFNTARGARALVPVPMETPPGPAVLGVEIMARTGRQRIALENVLIGARTFPGRNQVVPETKRPLIKRPEAVRDGRRLLLTLRESSPQAFWTGPFLPPVTSTPSATFGERETYIGGAPVEGVMDSIYGEYHRGTDYPAAVGTPVLAPAGGTVTMAEPLTLTGETLVIDHGQGIVSVFFHLSKIDVREGDRVEARTPVAFSGESGLALWPHVHWGVYLHGLPVDPSLFEHINDW